MSDQALSSPDHVSERALIALNQAALAISGELSPDATLQQIVDSARRLIDADYAALGVFTDAGELETFVTSGISQVLEEAIDHLPEGRGLLKAILVEKRSIRVPEIRSDPRSVGFPPGHPIMTTFLGVPIRAGEEVLGNLYFTDKFGGEAFTAEDEALIEIFANHAAVALRNADLYERTVQGAEELKARNRELAAVLAVARAASDYRDLQKVLQLTLDQIVHVTDMDAGEVFLLEEGTEVLQLAAHHGGEPDPFFSMTSFSRGTGFPGKVLELGQAMVTSDLDHEDAYLRHQVVTMGYRAFACIPIWAKGEVIGTLGLASKRQRNFPERDLELMESIARQLGVAVENARLYEEVGRLAIVEERSRIGMDLHDGVIQSIYAVGLTLETSRLLLRESPDKAHEMLDEAISGLNDAIRDIRNFILDLRPHHFAGDLGSGMARLVREFQANAMVEVDVRAPEELVRRLPAPVARAMFLTTQEALANVARHARANRVQIRLACQDGLARLSIQDDGRGFDSTVQAQSVGHGLANMQARADELGGEFHLQSAPGEGTTVTLAIPFEE